MFLMKFFFLVTIAIMAENMSFFVSVANIIKKIRFFNRIVQLINLNFLLMEHLLMTASVSDRL